MRMRSASTSKANSLLEVYFFYSAVLCVCVCVCVCVLGDDAVRFESLPDDVVVAKALSVLRSIFGDQAVSEV